MVLAAFVAFPVLAPSAQEPCACKHLDAIRKALAAKQGMRDYYQRSMDQLFEKEVPILQGQDPVEQKEAKLRELLRESDRAITGDTETLIPFNNQTGEPEPADLDREKARAPCREVAEAIAHHENYHHDVWAIRQRRQEARRTTHEIAPRMLMGLSIGAPSADRWEEVQAYDLEIGELKRLVERLTREMRYVLILKSVARMDWTRYMGPVGTAAEFGSTARIPLEIEEGPAPQRVSGSATRSFEGRIIGGACQYTGMPMAIPMTVDGTLDEGVFKLRIDKDGQRLPPFGVACPRSSGMATPGMAPPPPPPSVEIEARDGAKYPYPYATSAAAMMLSPLGRLSGDAILEIELACKEP
jgi:hypothetical protein